MKQPDNPAISQNRPRIELTAEFQDQVKEAFASMPESYQRFKHLVAEHRRESLHIPFFTAHMMMLLKGHPQLYKEFQKIARRHAQERQQSLQQQQQKHPQSPESPKILDLHEYNEHIKLQYKNQPAVYWGFLQCVRDWAFDNITEIQLKAQIKKLFAGRLGLIEHFNHEVLPKYSVAQIRQSILSTQESQRLPRPVTREVIQFKAPRRACGPIVAPESMRRQINAVSKNHSPADTQNKGGAVPSHEPHVRQPSSEERRQQREEKSSPSYFRLDQQRYRADIQTAFPHHPDMCLYFDRIWNELVGGKVDIVNTLARISGLFAPCASFVEGFARFLPAGYRVEVGLAADMPFNGVKHSIEFVTFLYTPGKDYRLRVDNSEVTIDEMEK